MDKTFLKKLNYIYWQREARKITVTNEEFVKIYNQFTQNGYKVSGKGVKTVRNNFKKNYSFYAEKVGNFKTIYARVNNEYAMWCTNCFDNNKNKRKENYTGSKAISLLVSRFAQRIQVEHRAFYKAFGTTPREFINCVPKQFSFLNPAYKNMVIENVSSIDACAHYPSNAMGALPDAHGAREFKGTIPPTKDLPFAFYLKSGHVAEYNKFDTHLWTNNYFAPFLFRDLYKTLAFPPEQDITILMPVSKYNLDLEWLYFYSQRKTDEDAKLVMNAAIGMLHTRRYENYRYAHLAAIILARANDKHLNKLHEIGEKNIIHVCVDGAMYKGSLKYGEDYKALNIYNQEFTGCTVGLKGPNSYIVKNKSGEIIKIKHGAYNLNKDGSPIDESKIKDFSDMDNWAMIKPKELEEEETNA